MADANLSVDITARIDNLERNLKKAIQEVRNAENQIDNSNKDTENSFKSLAKTIGTALVADKVLALGKAMLDITAKFEKYNAVLTNTLGSQAAASAQMGIIQDFASKTPFAVDELTAAYIKLANQGFLPTKNQLRQLGDLASSTGKSFDQLAEAILDAQTGEYERLKEFGIRAQDQGDKVTFTFKGVQTTVDKTSQSIRDYITALGDAEGVTGSMEAISKTLTGQISNLGDSWDALLVSFGNRTSGIFKSVISNVNNLVNKITEINNNIANAEKVGQSEGFFAYYLGRVKAMFTGRAQLTDVVGKDVELRQTEFLDKANQLIEGAKKGSDYDKAISKISDYYKSEANRLKDSKTLLASLKLAYDNATAYIEAQKAGSAKQGTANFGKASNKKEKTYFQVLQEDLTKLQSQEAEWLAAGNKQDFFNLTDRERNINALIEKIKELKKETEGIGGPMTGRLTGRDVQISQLAPVGPSANDMQGAIDKMQELIILRGQSTQAIKDENEEAKRQEELFSSVTNIIGGGLTTAFESALQGTQSFVSAMANFLTGLIAKLAAAALAAAVLAAVLSFTPLGGLFGGGKSFGNIFSAISGIPKLAEGGITNGPTLAMIGEGKEREVVAPLSKFNSLVNDRASNQNNNGGEWIVRGSDLVKVINRADKQKSRLS